MEYRYLVTDGTNHFLKTTDLNKAIRKADTITNGAYVIQRDTLTKVYINKGTTARAVTSADIIRSR